MKEHPIIFSGPMVKAILEGRKTQTRRVVKPQPPDQLYRLAPGPYFAYEIFPYEDNTRGEPSDENWLCPYGAPGDRLWVKETFAPPTKGFSEYHYRASGFYPGKTIKWIPSIFMPRKASRITLEVVKGRVERVQSITEVDAKAEGLFQWTRDDSKVFYGIDRPDVWEPNPVATFKRLWDSINAARGFGWDANPWVWVIEFKQVTP